MKQLIFNELTTVPLAKDFNEASGRVEKFLKTYQQKPSIFEQKIRLDDYIGDLQLTKSLSLQEFSNQTPRSRTLTSALLVAGKHPFLDPDSPEEMQYLEKAYTLHCNSSHHASEQDVPVIGLAAAYLNDTICIGFQ